MWLIQKKTLVTSSPFFPVCTTTNLGFCNDISNSFRETSEYNNNKERLSKGIFCNNKKKNPIFNINLYGTIINNVFFSVHQGYTKPLLYKWYMLPKKFLTMSK
jgi:hypothetical protein